MDNNLSHKLFPSPSNLQEMLQSRIRILTWNIQNPSLERAKLQAEWLSTIDAHILILTEAKVSQGCLFLQDWLQTNDFSVFFPNYDEKDYCVIIAIKDMASSILELNIDFLPQRIISTVCELFLGKATLMGLYVPSRGPRENRNVKKRQFQHEISTIVKSFVYSNPKTHLIIAGDLNVLERQHIPHYSVFGEWEYAFYEFFLEVGLFDGYRLLHPDSLEYSWFGRRRQGYRFDHFFVSSNLVPHIISCSYVHEARYLHLSDHSAMCLEIANV